MKCPKCKKCGYEWMPRGVPTECPTCRRNPYTHDKEKVSKPLGNNGMCQN